jgi:hypothetical protein
MEAKIWVLCAKRSHGLCDALGADGSGSFFHDVPSRQVQELAHAAGDLAPNFGDPSRAITTRRTQPLKNFRTRLLTDLRQSFRHIRAGRVEQRQHELDEFVLCLLVFLQGGQERDRFVQVLALLGRQIVRLQFFELCLRVGQRGGLILQPACAGLSFLVALSKRLRRPVDAREDELAIAEPAQFRT